MNESGPCLSAFLKHRDINPREMIVVADDFSCRWVPFAFVPAVLPEATMV